MLNGMTDFIGIMDAVQDLTSAEVADWIKQVIEFGEQGSTNGLFSVSHSYIELAKSRKKLSQFAATKIATEAIIQHKGKTIKTSQNARTSSKEEFDKHHEKYPTAGYCYLFKSNKDGTYKIGISGRPKSRAMNIGRDRCEQIEVIHTIYTANPLLLEKTLHKKYETKCVFGEWFNLSDKDVNQITSIADEIDKPSWEL